MRAVPGAMTKPTLGQHIAFTCLTAQEPSPAQTKVGEFEVSVLVDEQIVWLQVTVETGKNESVSVNLTFCWSVLTGEPHPYRASTPGPERPQQYNSSSTPRATIPDS